MAGAVALKDPGLRAAAREAFTASMSTTFMVSAIGVLAAALPVTLVMWEGRQESEKITDREPEFVASPLQGERGLGWRSLEGMPSGLLPLGVAESSTLN